MKTRWWITALTALAGAAPAFAGHAHPPAPAGASAASAPVAAPVSPADSLAAHRLAFATDSMAADRLHLAQAVLEQSRGNLRGMIENLEALDYAPTPAFQEADRAAFLLGHAYLALGRHREYQALAEIVARWNRASVYTAWIAYQRLAMLSDEAGTPAAARDSSESAATAGAAAATQGGEAATVLAASLWIRSGHPEQALAILGGASAPAGASAAVLCMRAAALQQSGGDNSADLNALALADTASALGRDLAGLARIQLATRAIGRHEDARALLEGVPSGSRYEGRAHQMLGLMALEDGDRTSGRQWLEGELAADSSGAAWREVAMALAGQDLDDARWDSADHRYRQIDQDWNRQRDSLQAALQSGSFDRLWSSWKAQPGLDSVLVVDELPARLLADQLASASADLSQRPALVQPPLSITVSPGSAVPAPAAADWETVTSSERDLASARERSKRGAGIWRARTNGWPKHVGISALARAN